MKAAVLTQLNAPLEIWDIEPQMVTHDRVCGAGQVFVDVTASGICGSQLQEIAGNKGNREFVPHLMGHEGVGRVRQVGPGVSVQLIGKKVCMHWREGSGPKAFQSARYDYGNVSVGAGHVTTLCEQAVVSANRVTVVEDDVPDELCALLGCGLSTALGTIQQEAKVLFGESVLIIGCGGVGLNLIQAAKLACAYPIVAVDIVDEKAETCKKLGAHRYVNTRKESIADTLNAFDLKGFDVIIDTSGNVEALEEFIQRMAPSGRLVMVGQPTPGQSFKIISAVEMFHGEGKRIIATQGGGFKPSEMIPRYVKLWRSGVLDMESIITHRIGLEDINAGIELVRHGQAGRILVHMR